MVQIIIVSWNPIFYWILWILSGQQHLGTAVFIAAVPFHFFPPDFYNPAIRDRKGFATCAFFLFESTCSSHLRGLFGTFRKFRSFGAQCCGGEHQNSHPRSPESFFRKGSWGRYPRGTCQRLASRRGKESNDYVEIRKENSHCRLRCALRHKRVFYHHQPDDNLGFLSQ